MTTISILTTAGDPGLTRRDLAWAFTFPHQSRKPAPTVAVDPADRPWAALRRLTGRLWQGSAGVTTGGRFSLAGQAQDFSDLSWAMSLPAGRTGGAATAAMGRGSSCN